MKCLAEKEAMITPIMKGGAPKLALYDGRLIIERTEEIFLAAKRRLKPLDTAMAGFVWSFGFLVSGSGCKPRSKTLERIPRVSQEPSSAKAEGRADGCSRC